MRLLTCLFAFAFLALVPLLPAQAQSDSDRARIQAIIRSQIEAFQRDDGAAAYSYAAPSLKQVFPTVDGFMAMVKNGYTPLYRPKSYSFGEVKSADGKLLQALEVLGPNGDYWEAIYTFVRQEDGSWKIVSCYLVKAKDTSA